MFLLLRYNTPTEAIWEKKGFFQPGPGDDSPPQWGSMMADGGQGGKTRLGTKGACGGKQILENICNNNLINGLDGAMHNIVPNKYGGSGGGGGGSDGVLQGTGGEGGAGYVRIRWETNK